MGVFHSSDYEECHVLVCDAMWVLLEPNKSQMASNPRRRHSSSSDNVRFEVFTAVTVKNGVFRDVTPCGFVRTDVLKELSASIIKVTRIGELGTTLAITSNQHTAKKYR
jgi:hypothetical protein